MRLTVHNSNIGRAIPGTILLGDGNTIKAGEGYTIIGNDNVLHGTGFFVKGDKNTILGTACRVTGQKNKFRPGIHMHTVRGSVVVNHEGVTTHGDVLNPGWERAPTEFWPAAAAAPAKPPAPSSAEKAADHIQRAELLSLRAELLVMRAELLTRRAHDATHRDELTERLDRCNRFLDVINRYVDKCDRLGRLSDKDMRGAAETLYTAQDWHNAWFDAHPTPPTSGAAGGRISPEEVFASFFGAKRATPAAAPRPKPPAAAAPKPAEPPTPAAQVRQAYERSDIYTFLVRIYKEWPPANPEHTLALPVNADNVRQRIRSALVHYHPDKNKSSAAHDEIARVLILAYKTWE
jgi:hypothetical protein